MAPLLAYADNTDTSEGNFLMLFLCAGAVIGVFVLAGMVVVVSRRGGHRYADAILTFAVFWGMVSFGSIIYAAVTQMKWSQEHLLELQSGYGNPANVGPGWPWGLWVGLGVVYVALLGWAALRK